ncbi:hypothetical protein ILUMI_03915 [Ignelater luminosus]|uniref:Uncharacterized protein n=1 Tax=Ignelater luminosus TaxID=2038154 RepID=A0A8K0GHV6_IGNLU|nr:hypothetical protein ILUMI_03915 [Ignelater luminosus]
MKQIYGLLLLLLPAHDCFTCNMTGYEMRQQWKGIEAPIEQDCIRKTGVKQETVDAFYDHEAMPNERAWKCFIECSGLREHFLSLTGDVDLSGVEKYACVTVPLAQSCEPVHGPDPCERAYLFLTCMIDNLPK